MRYDLLAGAGASGVRALPLSAPTILVFDSGVGGLTVLSEVMRARPDARFIYAADDAAFPYGRLSEDDLRARVPAVIEKLIARFSPDAVVIACNTASTVALPVLRARFSIPFVGTVPAVKPAAALSRSRIAAVLATPGTVARDYTRDLIETYAGDCEMLLVGSTKLASLAEAHLRGEPVSDEAIAAEIAPCFVERKRADGYVARTDVIALSCTHYPLLRESFERLAAWPVTYIDPAPAIARRVTQLIGESLMNGAMRCEAVALFTSGAGLTPALKAALAARGLDDVAIEAMPLALN
ncbi:glutamate racemase [Terrarubrum flagellatum]|uniref:glutamate racemase n=1 Tax=Terrirubrum flagellatum TaxID=2895980 RepID=UPI003145036C